MPRPIYVIPSQYASEDKTTNLVTMGGIIEQFTIDPDPVPVTTEEEAQRQFEQTGILQHEIHTSKIYVIAVWMREDGDIDRKFLHQLVLKMPGSPEVVFAPLVFKFDKVRPFRRFKGVIVGIPPVRESGYMEIESRILSIDSDKPDKWLSQSYPIGIVVADLSSETKANKSSPSE